MDIIESLIESETEMYNKCHNCFEKKQRKDSDLCYKCAKAKAKTLGIKNLSMDRYMYGDGR